MAIVDIQKLSFDLKVATTGQGGQFDRFEYGYLGEINAMRGLSNTDFIMLLLPPSSVMPEPYKNLEEITCVFHCYTKAPAGTTNANQGLENTHDALKEKCLRTLANLCIDEEHKYVINSGITFERTSREFNQEYIGLIATVTINCFTTCMPYSFFTNIQ